MSNVNIASHDAHSNALTSLLPEDEATHIAINSGSWFDTTTWADGEVPGINAKVLIPEGVSVHYSGKSDESLDVIRVDGNLSFSTTNSSKVVVDTILTNAHSKLSIGSEGNPVQEGVKVEILIADNGAIDTSWDPTQISRGVIAMGEVEMHGQEKTVHLKVADAPMSGDTVLTLDQTPENWTIGDKIVVAGTHHDDFLDSGSRQSQDEIRIVTAINGNEVSIDRPLEFNHDSPTTELATSVANYTRNIVIASENAEGLDANERGHTMFMHNADVDVRYVEFYELGRTDKSKRLDDFELEAVVREGPNATVDYGRVDKDEDGVADAGEMTNIRGRYSVHFHEAGNMESEDAGYMEGNAVWGSPGWGYVNHDSNADFINNAAYGVFGAGFVGETGNETGLMKGNISIYNEGTPEQFSPGSDARAAFHGTLNQDMGYAGFGYWFNGRLIELEDNIAAGAGEAGFGWTTRGVDSISPTKSTIVNDLLARGHNSINHADDATISVFEGNEVIAAWKGLLIDGLGAIKNHNGHNELSDFTGWGIEKTGLEISYSSKYLIDNVRLYSDEDGYASFGVGIRIEVSTEQVVIKDSSVQDFRRGVVNVNQTNSSKGDAFIPDRDINLVNVEILGNVGASIENTTLASVATKVFDGEDDFPGHELNLVFDDSSLRFTRDWAEIRAMFPNFWTAIQAYKGQEGLMVRGTKYDTMGTTEFPFGNEMARFDRSGVNEILSEQGYQTLRDGTKVVVLGELITDRYTGETREKYFVTELPDWWIFDGRQVDAGSYVHYTGVYRPNFITATNIETYSTTGIDEVVSERRAEDSTELEEPMDHTDHADPETPTDHGDHTDPEMPTDHGDHTDPEVPTDHGDHTDPEVPTDHGDHTDPEVPTDHGDHTDPEVPTEHEDPSEPSDHTPVVDDQPTQFEGQSGIRGDFFFDLNNDDVFDASVDEYVEGVRVDLLDGSGTFLAKFDTTRYGTFHFEDLIAGNYKIVAHLPDGHKFIAANVGNLEGRDSDITDIVNGMTGTLSLQDSEYVSVGIGIELESGPASEEISEGDQEPAYENYINVQPSSQDQTLVVGVEDSSTLISWMDTQISHEKYTVRLENIRIEDIRIEVTPELAVAEDDTELLRILWDSDGVEGYLDVENLGGHIDRFEFADDVSFTHFGPKSIVIDMYSAGRDGYRGTDGDDYIIGGDDSSIVIGGAGNDILEVGGTSGPLSHLQGQSGDDTYLIDSDDGVLMISTGGETQNGGTDHVHFTDISIEELSFFEDPSNGRLSIKWNKDEMAGELIIAEKGRHIEQFKFQDGSNFSHVHVDLYSAGRDGFFGTSGDDYIVGGSESSLVIGGDGDDTLEVGGSSGSLSHLQGQSGDDTYLIDKNDGSIMISSGGERENGGYDVIVFQDLLFSEVTLSKDANSGNSVIEWNDNGTAGEVFVANFGAYVEQIEFADGVVFDADNFWL